MFVVFLLGKLTYMHKCSLLSLFLEAAPYNHSLPCSHLSSNLFTTITIEVDRGSESLSKQTCDPPPSLQWPSLHPAPETLSLAAWMCLCACSGSGWYTLQQSPAAGGLTSWHFQRRAQVVSTSEWSRKPPCRDIYL